MKAQRIHDGRRTTQRQTEQITEGSAVSKKWSESFDLRICHEVTGSESESQRFFPSSETDGAVRQFIVVIRQVATAAITGRKSSLP